MKNLPLLLTVEEVAELMRCSVSTISRQRAFDPNWLKPASTVHSRKLLFFTSDVLARIGVPLREGLPHVTPIAATWRRPMDEREQVDRAAQTRSAERALARQAARDLETEPARAAWSARVKTHLPSAWVQGRALGNRKLRVEVDDAGVLFKLTMVFMGRYRVDGWPESVELPRGGPVWLSLESKAERHLIDSEIAEIMSEYQPLWMAKLAAQKQQREGQIQH